MRWRRVLRYQWNVLECGTQWSLARQAGGEEFDIIGVAEKHFDVTEKCLIVREKGKAWHWHIHGTPLDPAARRKVAREMNAMHPDRARDTRSVVLAE